MNSLVEIDLDETDDQIILEEYKIWKKNAPFMYDTMITHVLEWPSLTVQWAVGRECSPNLDFSLQSLLLGTFTGTAEQDQLIQAKVKVPMEQSLISGKIYLDNTKDAGGVGLISKTENKIEVNLKISHEREVLRARMMPSQESIVATKSPNSLVYIYDLKKHSLKSSLSAQLALTGHNKEGKGLSWCPNKQGLLASGSNDHLVIIWDIAQSSGLPLRSYIGHESIVEDVSWNDTGVLASVGHDKKVLLWDLRQESPTHIIEAHAREITSAHFNPNSSNLLATGSKDKTIGIWDLRNTSLKVCGLNSHKDSITSIKWAPESGNLLASASNDRRIMIWDLSRIGRPQSPEEAEDGPPELVFIHGGHTSLISDLAWNPNEDLTLASVAEDNILQVWQVSNSIFN
jgi:histone-binding protein RBBP4